MGQGGQGFQRSNDYQQSPAAPMQEPQSQPAQQPDDDMPDSFEAIDEDVPF
jgi:hypothetical protein